MFAKDYRQMAWSHLSGKWGKMAVVGLIFALLVGITAGFGSAEETASGFTYSIDLVTLILTGPLTVGICGICLNLLRGREPDVAELFTPFKNFASVFLLYFLNTLFTALWMLLLIVPGIIKSLSYSMSYFIMAENPSISQADARRTSMRMMEGHKWELFCLEISFIGWLLLSALTFGILLCWVIPYMYTAQAAFYENIRLQYTASSSPFEPQAQPQPEAWDSTDDNTDNFSGGF